MVKQIAFHNAVSDFELLDKIRVRHQMFANNLSMLHGVLVGYHLAKNKEAEDSFKPNISDFHQYLSKQNQVNATAVSWVEQITNEVEYEEYEISKFFEYLDAFREIQYESLGEAILSFEQRDFDFRRRLKGCNIDDAKHLPLHPIPPHTLKAVKIPNVKVHAFFYDENGNKYNEQCLGDMDQLINWAKECFDIHPSQWEK